MKLFTILPQVVCKLIGHKRIHKGMWHPYCVRCGKE